MKRILTFCLLATICFFGFYSCSLQDDEIEPTGNTELDGFFKSSAYSRFTASYKLGESNFQLDRLNNNILTKG